MKSKLLFLIVASFAFVATGCAQCVDCGKLRQSSDVTSNFTSVSISPDYTYYTFNETENRAPVAIVGLDKKYKVQTTMWKQSSFTEEQLASWVNEYRVERGQYDDFYEIPIHYKGWNVLDPNGVKVGEYFSTLEWTIFKFISDDVVQLGAPQPSTLQKSQQRFSR